MIPFLRTVRSTIWIPGKATDPRVLAQDERLDHPSFASYLVSRRSLDPVSHIVADRITVAWCKKFDVPVERLFSKTLLQKCTFSLGFQLLIHTIRSPC